jgi:hypothetical protein
LWSGACSGYNRSTSRSAYKRTLKANAKKKEGIMKSQSAILLPIFRL